MNPVKFKNDLQNNLRRFLLRSICLMIGIVILSGAAARATFAQNSRTGKTPDPSVLEAEKLLVGLGYWITKIDGVKDASTYHAVAAFQKAERRKRTGVLTASEIEAMKNAARPSPRFTGEAHIEIDVTRQILFMVDSGGIVTIILPVSTGSEESYFSGGKWQTAHTPRGEFKVTRQIFGVRRAPLGNLYYPNYFSGGVAIHGSASIPFKPASHGCVRIPNFAAKEFQTLVAIGTKVFVYD